MYRDDSSSAVEKKKVLQLRGLVLPPLAALGIVKLDILWKIHLNMEF